MPRFVLALALVLALPALAPAQDRPAKIDNAMSAAPASVARNATIVDWDQTVLREGTNGWTCLPSVPDTPGNDPMCLDTPWLNWLDAYANQKPVKNDRVGFGYMLAGSSPESNVDPHADGPTADNEWIDRSIPHIMMIVPDPKMLEGLPTDWRSGGPWVMWKGTPYVHVMIPTPEPGHH